MSLPEVVSRQELGRQYHVGQATYHDRYGILEGEER